jgi:hypothetical protein
MRKGVLSLLIANREEWELDYSFPHTKIVGSLVGTFCRRLVCPSFSVPLAFLSLALLAPAPARAGCDYPTHIERTPVDLPESIPTAPKSDSRLPGKPCSCTGPHCSRAPLAPSAPTSVESVKISEWGRLLPRLLLTPPQSDDWTAEIPFSHTTRHPSSIYHPPRLPL